MENCIRLLLVEDDPSDAALVIRRLVNEGFNLDWQRVDNKEDYVSALEAGCDLILSDWNLPDFSGLQALLIRREMGWDIPFVIVSGSIGGEAAVDALHKGAFDYVLKDHPERLGQVVRNALEESSLRLEYEQAEKILRVQSAALNAAANAIVITHPDGKIEWINEAFTVLTGYSQGEAVGKKMGDLLKSGLHDQAFYQDLWNCIVAGKVWRGEMINRRKDGQVYYEEQTITPVLDSSSRITRYIAIKQDVTRRKQDEQELRQTHEYLDNLLNHANGPIIVWGADLKVSRINLAFEHLTGLDAGEVIGKPLEALFLNGNKERLTELIEQTRSSAHHDSVEIPISNRSGDSRIILWSSANLYDHEDRRIVATIAQGQDITERKQAEKQLLEATEELSVAYDATLMGWSNALELREHETAGHSKRVVQLTMLLARLMGMEEEDLIHVQRGALLHDIGKMGIPDSILLKPGPLTEEEWVIMRQHPVHAFNLVSPIPYLAPALDIPYYHHEHWDGSGYPTGLKGEDIPLAARIFAIVDVWDALSSDRPYRRAWKKEDIFEYLKEQSGKHFDPEVVRVFLEVCRMPLVGFALDKKGAKILPQHLLFPDC